MPEGDAKISHEDVQQVIREAIVDAVKGEYTHPAYLLKLAEAEAWLRNPNQSHGGPTSDD